MSRRIFRLLGALSLPAMLGACAAAVVGGAAAGGYAVATHDRTGDSAAADAAITSRINTRYVDDSLVTAMDIKVSTYRGSVTLAGSVPSREVARRAVAIARSVEGVVQVIDRLKVVSR